MKKAFCLLLLILFTIGYTVAPNYKRPKVDVPVTYRSAAQGDGSEAQPSPGQQAPDAATPQQTQPASEPSLRFRRPAVESVFSLSLLSMP